MAFTFKSNCLIDSTTFSQLVYGVTDGSTGLTAVEKANVEFLVNSTNDKIVKYINRNLIQTTHTEVLDSSGSDVIFPKEYPINSVTSIKFSSVNSGFATAQALDSDYYGIRDSEHIYLIISPNWVGRGKIQIVYNAGYILADIPSDLKYALVLQYKMDRKLVNVGEQTADSSIYESGSSKMGESFSANKTFKDSGFAKEVLQILDTYKRCEVPNTVMFNRVF